MLHYRYSYSPKKYNYHLQVQLQMQCKYRYRYNWKYKYSYHYTALLYVTTTTTTTTTTMMTTVTTLDKTATTTATTNYATPHYTKFSSCGWLQKSTTQTTFQSISGFAPPSMHHNKSPLLYLSILDSRCYWYKACPTIYHCEIPAWLQPRYVQDIHGTSLWLRTVARSLLDGKQGAHHPRGSGHAVKDTVGQGKLAFLKKILRGLRREKGDFSGNLVENTSE